MGLHWDLERTLRNATIETIKFLTQEMGLTDVKALSQSAPRRRCAGEER